MRYLGKGRGGANVFCGITNLSLPVLLYDKADSSWALKGSIQGRNEDVCGRHCKCKKIRRDRRYFNSFVCVWVEHE
jgi:hypothetical protein